MASLLYYILEKKTPYKDTIAVGDGIKEKLKSIRDYLLIPKLLQKAVIGELFDAFEKERIPVIPLKGACLAEKYYPNATLRNMADIDILVQPTEKKKSTDCMRKLGFVFHSSRHDERHYHENHFHIPYAKMVSGIPVIVELHFHIALQSVFNNIQIQDFWLSASPISSKYTCVLVPRNELILLHCMWHTYLNISKTGNIKLFWLMDIIFIIRDTKRDIEWDFLASKLKETRLQKRAYFCMDLVETLSGVSLHDKMPKLLLPSYYEKALFDYILLNCDRLENVQNISLLRVSLKLKKELVIPLLKHISIEGFSAKGQFLKQVLVEMVKNDVDRIVY